MRNNSWFAWILVLFFGWSIAGGIASVLVSQLGFPYTWIYPLTLVMLGVVLFLVYRGYPVQAWLLAACIGFIVLSGMAMARALTIPAPDVPDIYRAEFDDADLSDSLFGFDVPIYDDYSIWDYYIDYNVARDAYLIAPGYEQRTPITIQFPPLETAGGQWAFVSGSVELSGAVRARLEADPQNNWLTANEINFSTDLPLRAINPEMTVVIPLPSTPARGTLTVDAALKIVYPQGNPDPEVATLTRRFDLRIIGDDYYLYYDRYINWRRSRSVTETPVWIALLAGSLLSGAASVYLVRQGALVPQPSSGLRMVVRRLTGAQKLGAELHALKKFRGRTGAEQGVFVGRVVAQSPAGRAGLMTGDVLLTLDAKPTNSPSAINRIAGGRKKGDVVTATVLRHGEEIELRVRF